MLCKECGKEITGKNKFCNKSCAAKYNNRARIKTGYTTKNKIKTVNCIECGKEIQVSVHTRRTLWKCNNCKKHNRPHFKDITTIKTIMDFSKRTVVSILKRMNAKCSLCGWSESTCDIHHIIPKKQGGTDDMNNLICICPNCHRLCHTTTKYPIGLLKKHSLDIEYKDWRKYYHPSN